MNPCVVCDLQPWLERPQLLFAFRCDPPGRESEIILILNSPAVPLTFHQGITHLMSSQGAAQDRLNIHANKFLGQVVTPGIIREDPERCFDEC